MSEMHGPAMDVCRCKHARLVHARLWCETCRGWGRFHRFHFTWTLAQFVEVWADVPFGPSGSPWERR